MSLEQAREWTRDRLYKYYSFQICLFNFPICLLRNDVVTWNSGNLNIRLSGTRNLKHKVEMNKKPKTQGRDEQGT